MAEEVAVIIGSGSIGVAIGRVAGIGRRVLLADYNEDTMSVVAGQFRGEGYDVTTHRIDISSHEAAAGLADAAATMGSITPRHPRRRGLPSAGNHRRRQLGSVRVIHGWNREPSGQLPCRRSGG